MLPNPRPEMLKAKAAAKKFSDKWLQRAGDEKQETQQFWSELLRTVFGVDTTEDVMFFEERVEVGRTHYIDVHIPSTQVIIEQKSAGIDLTAPQEQSDGAVLTPYEQAKRYSDNLPQAEHSRWIVTCNFREIRVHDMSLRKESERAMPVSIISLQELPEHYHRLSFLVDKQSVRVAKEKKVSVQAGELISKIYNALLERCEAPNDPVALQHLNKFCVRLVFCLYAEDAGLFKKDQFEMYLSASANPREARQRLLSLFSALNMKVGERDPYDEELLAFPYVNGGLFADERLIIPMLDEELLNLILHDASAGFDWQYISPTIFGSLFESTLNPDTRRSGGMHYTSIENIHKVIDPLFMDDLKAEFYAIQHSDKAARKRRIDLVGLQDKIAQLTILDPACGSGNFLTEAFISLRRLENEILREICRLEHDRMQDQLMLTKVGIHQFFGIEINDFAVSVAKTALWIADAQMWEETQSILHNRSAFLPLKQYEGIRKGNALRMDWLENIPNRHVDYIIGNPPFVGHQWRSRGQAEDMDEVFAGHDKYGKLDYVCSWFRKAANYMRGTKIRTSFVATNSISQGESVGCLWKPLFDEGMAIDFAYRTFVWENEAKDEAAVHCVVVGFSCGQNYRESMLITERGEIRAAKHINGYLVDAPDLFIQNRGLPLTSQMPKMSKGSQPTGNPLILKDAEKIELLTQYPEAEKCIRRYVGSEELINNKKRWCLWLKGIPPAVYRNIPPIIERLKNVAGLRAKSPTASVRRNASTPALFTQIRQPDDDYIAVPEVSSSNREYIPIDILSKDTICSNKLYILPVKSLYYFGVISSALHMAWVKTVAGRLKSDYSYSPAVYNNFPWPSPTEAQKLQIEDSAQNVIDTRKLFPDCSLADLYDPLLMPPELRKAHQKLDAAVEKAYGRKFKDDADRVAFLFDRYKELTEH